jgi:peptide deformylase
MAVHEVLRYPHRALKREARTLADPRDAAAVAADLLDTMRAHQGCVGLAAPQLGELVRVIVVDVSEHPKAESASGLLLLVNPVVVRASGAHVAREGCLSIPHLTANVRRATSVSVEASTPEGEAVSLSSEGFEARCLLHEIDHLDGILFLDRVDSLAADVFRRKRFARPEAEGGPPPPEGRPAGKAVLRATARLNQAFADGDMAPLAGLVADDVELEPPADLPDPGPFHGGDAAADFLLSLADSWDELRVDVESVLAADESRAVVRLHLSARGTGSGIQTVGTLIGAFWMRDGRIQRVRLGRDEAEALAATGLAGG